MMERWEHQTRAARDVQAAIQSGQRAICVTSPTGGGKTLVMADLIDLWSAEGLNTVLYTNRRLLLEQTHDRLDGFGIDFGVRAANWNMDSEHFYPVQLSSIQTEHARVFKQQRWNLHNAQRVLIDEAHTQTGGVAQRLIAEHTAAGAAVVGLTATPLGLGDLYTHLIVAGCPSELRKCGALVPAIHYAPDEPDLRGIKLAEGQDLTERQAVSAIMRNGIFGRVLEWFDKLNPTRRPTILFAPGVRESIWFMEQFQAHGITAAHIDGEEVRINGKVERSSREARKHVLESSRDGRITVLCNRFVLREGIDAPWLGHCILATVFGSLQSYLQAGGRLLRADPSLETVTVQDHGGNYWRHGSLNADRQWCLSFTNAIAAGLRADALRDKRDAEPVVCPKCKCVLKKPPCKICGWQPAVGWRKSRAVVQHDGTLKEMHGDIYRPRRVCQRPDGPELWARMYHRSCTERGRRTFRAAAALFAQEQDWGWPDKAWPLMPKDPLDWFRHVADVPREALTE